MRQAWYWCIFCFLALQSIGAVTNPDFSRPQTFLYFADDLADKGDYYRAITEYKRVLFHFPEYDKKEWVAFQIGRMYHLGGRFDSAKEYLTPLTASDSERLNFLARNWMALTYFENSEYVNSARLFSELYSSGKADEGTAIDYVAYQAMSRFYLHEFDNSEKLFNKLKAESPDPAVKQFTEKSLAINSEAADRSKKSPALAAFLGVLPGAGHLYLGQWDTALVSLIVVAGTGFLAYDGFRRDSLVQSSIFLTFATGFYAGSIYSAYREAARYNLTMYNEDHRQMNRAFRRLTLRVSSNF